MIQALRDKGWQRNGQTQPGQAGNRPDKAIRAYPKWRFLCEVSTTQECEQAAFERWSA